MMFLYGDTTTTIIWWLVGAKTTPYLTLPFLSPSDTSLDWLQHVTSKKIETTILIQQEG